MFNSQQKLDELLDKEWTIPIEIDERGDIPKTNPFYTNLMRELDRGFKLTARELLHAIGCKTASLPTNYRDNALIAAFLYVFILDLESKTLCLKDFIEPDLKAPRSQEIGIGMTCLIAKRYFGVEWDQLEPIVKSGKRFDYRATIKRYRKEKHKAIFEAKGTSNRRTQKNQVKKGLEKKSDLGEKSSAYDVKLIISTYIGIENSQEPRILIADPIAEDGNKKMDETFYRYRHYARVLQYMGLPEIARKYYLISSIIRKGRPAKEIDVKKEYELTTININNIPFVGKWFDYWVPVDSIKYRKLLEKEKKLATRIKEMKKIRLFQGIIKENFDKLINGQLEEIKLLTRFQTKFFKKTQGDVRISVFPDGTLSAFKLEK